MSSILSSRSAPVEPAVFNDFFSLGKEESSSPFLTPQSRRWAINLGLKASLLSAILLTIAFILSFIPSWVSLSHFLLVAVYFFAGIPSLIEAIEDLTEFDVNIDVLMTVAAFSSILIGSSMEGALLLVLFSLSGSIEDAVTTKAKGSLNTLHKLSPTKACVVDAQGNTLERSVQDISVGTPILVKAGEVVPLDGRVIAGISSVNLVHLTGESLPVMKKLGDEVPAGAQNMDGVLTLEVVHTNIDSTVARIIQLVTQAQESRPALQRWFDQLSRGYALTIISLSAFFALSFPFLLQIPFLGIGGSIYRALAFLIAASPCALILAIPIAYLSAVSACAKKGILLKGGITLDALAKCRNIAFDKTGTLTTGELTCTGIEAIRSAKPRSEREIVSIAYGLEKNAVHPIARAIVRYAEENKINPTPLEEFKSIPGYGLQAQLVTPLTNISVFMGHPDYIISQLSPHEIDILQDKISLLKERGELLAILLMGEDLYLFSFLDTIRPNLKHALQHLKQEGDWKLIMLTGDHRQNARRIADELSIDEFYADLRPENKLDHVIQMSEHGLAMIGDGINDAPALARATVGICMGKVGSGAAIEAADVVFLHDNLERLDWLMRKAKQTQKIVKQNLIIASAAILIAALPALAGIVPLWLAVVMHEGGTVLVGLNALRLLK